jgi:phage terminase large subunit
MKRSYHAHEIGNAAKVIGVDVARFGDDESALAFRQGIQAFPFRTYRNLDSTYGADLVARAWVEYLFGANQWSRFSAH